MKGLFSSTALCACVTILFAIVAGWSCFAADTPYGVLVEERVVSLPQDSGKWYLSVVGDPRDTRYREILAWFDASEDLKNLKAQVHFWQVASDSAIYRGRYAANVGGLPTVRMQQPDGTVVYEASGDSLPMTAEGLYGALAGGVLDAQGIRFLPWRREMERRCPGPGPCPTPSPEPAPEPEPQPLDSGGAPVIDRPVESGVPVGVSVGAAVACVVAGAAAGFVVQWKKTYQRV